MRESEGGTLKHTLQYLYIGNTAQERPSHPSIFSAGRAKPLSTSPGSPNVFTTRSTTTTTNNTTTDRVIHSLGFTPRWLLTTATGPPKSNYGASSSSSSIGGCGRCKTHVGVYTTRVYAYAYAYAAQSDSFETWM